MEKFVFFEKKNRIGIWTNVCHMQVPRSRDDIHTDRHHQYHNTDQTGSPGKDLKWKRMWWLPKKYIFSVIREFNCGT